jgi:plasmid stabilization system protein ParE
LAQVIYSLDAVRDLDRLEDFLRDDRKSAREAFARIFECVALLRRSPELGRRVAGDIRELVISRGGSGCLALYRFDAGVGIVRVLRIRHQREAGYGDSSS